MIEIVKSNWQLVVSLAAGILWLLNAYKTILEIIHKRKEIKLIELQIDEKEATNIIELPRVQELKNTIRVTEEQIKVLGKNLTITTGIVFVLFSISIYTHFESKELRIQSIANLKKVKILENQVVYLDSLNRGLTNSTDLIKELQNLQAYNNLLVTNIANQRDSISILSKKLRGLRRENYELAQKIEHKDSIILEHTYALIRLEDTLRKIASQDTIEIMRARGKIKAVEALITALRDTAQGELVAAITAAQPYVSTALTLGGVAWKTVNWMEYNLGHDWWVCEYEDGTKVYYHFKSKRSVLDMLKYFTGQTSGDCDAFKVINGIAHHICYQPSTVQRLEKEYGKIVDIRREDPPPYKLPREGEK